jgi:hypothetical protein
MTIARSAGRAAGLLLLAQGIGAALTNFVLLQPALAAPGFLANAAPHGLRLGASVLIGIVTGALALAIAITVLPVLKKYSERLTFAFLALAIAAMALAVVENGTVMSLLSLSKAYVAANGADPALFEGLRGVVAASRNWAHFTHIVVGGATVFVFYAALYRFALVPRALAGFGMAAFALQIATVSMPFFGIPVRFALLAPAGIANLALAAWLVTKGFTDRPAAAM